MFVKIFRRTRLFFIVTSIIIRFPNLHSHHHSNQRHDHSDKSLEHHNNDDDQLNNDVGHVKVI